MASLRSRRLVVAARLPIEGVRQTMSQCTPQNKAVENTLGCCPLVTTYPPMPWVSTSPMTRESFGKNHYLPLAEAEKDAVHHGSDHSVAHRQSQNELKLNPNHRSVSGEWARGGDLVAGQTNALLAGRRDHTPHKDGVESAAWLKLRCHEGGVAHSVARVLVVVQNC